MILQYHMHGLLSAVDFSANPCSEEASRTDPTTGSVADGSARRRRSLGDGVVIKVPVPEKSKRDLGDSASNDVGSASYDVWCKTCDWNNDDEDCLANGEWTRCHDAVCHPYKT
jgi:hypothetical protein